MSTTLNLGRVQGYSAYEVAVQQGYVGTRDEWLASLKGEKGDTGETGATGPQGPQGPQGEQGNTGSSVDYPYELVNNVTTDDATKGLSAAQGVVLDGKITELGPTNDYSVNKAIKKMFIDTSNYSGSVDISGGLKIIRLFKNNNGKYGVRLANSSGTSIEDWTENSATHIVRKRDGLFAYIELDYAMIAEGATTVDASINSNAFLPFNDIRPTIVDFACSETYKITSITRNSAGDITSLSITYLDGATGTLTLTRNADGDVTLIKGIYNQFAYDIGVTRDSAGDVQEINITY